MKKVFPMKKMFSVIGMVVGLAFIIVGILATTGALGYVKSNHSYAPYTYDSGYAQFGSDYYSYSNNNAAEAASAARSVADNIEDAADFLMHFFGLSSMLFGLMVICAFGIVFASCLNEAKTIPANVSSDSFKKEFVPEEVAAE